MASTKSRRRARTRPERYTSNVFSMFTEAQINEFKEAFGMIDINKDGIIDRDDLMEIFKSLGKDPSPDYISDMLSQARNQMNFTMFLTSFGEKMTGCDPEDTISNAFECFDPEGTGLIPEARLRQLLVTMGDRWTEEKVDELFHGAPIRDGNFDYKEFTRMIVHGQDDEEQGG